MRRPAKQFVLMATGMVLLAMCQSARAGAIINIDQVGSDVLTSGSGTIDLTDLTLHGSNLYSGFGNLDAVVGAVAVGPSRSDIAYQDIYDGVNESTTFGSGGTFIANSGSGDAFGIAAYHNVISVPHGYVSGTALSGTDTYANETFSDLGLTPGTYRYTWGTAGDSHADSLTVQIGPAGQTAAVPLPSSLAGGSAVLLLLAGGTWLRRGRAAE